MIATLVGLVIATVHFPVHIPKANWQKHLQLVRDITPGFDLLQSDTAGGDIQERGAAGVSRLIDQLTEVSEESNGSSSLALFEQFIAIDDDPEFSGGMLGVSPPKVDQRMRRLAQLGLRALPLLLDHLTDSRPTKLVVQHGGGLGGMWFASEYDPRVRIEGSTRGSAKDFLRNRKDVPNSAYIVRVGDLCYIVLGQIVNRQLLAVRPQPTNCIVLNSPVESPVLAVKARRDWAWLTATEHQESLVQDAKAWDMGALKRLLFYYPATGVRIALADLSRYLEDWDAADALYERADKVKSAAELSKLREEGLERLHCDAAMVEWGSLQHDLDWESSSDKKRLIREKISALFGDVEPKKDSRADAVIVFEFSALADALRCFGDPALDRSCFDFFLRMKSSLKPIERDQFYLESMAMAFADRLLRSGHRLGLTNYSAYLTKRARVHEAKGESVGSNAWLGRIEALLKRLTPRP